MKHQHITRSRRRRGGPDDEPELDFTAVGGVRPALNADVNHTLSQADAALQSNQD
jgi:hypothetical protein